MRRIDWRHVAKTGEFITVEYRADSPRRTAVVVDVRPESRLRPARSHPTGASRSVDLAERVEQGLEGTGALAGAAAVGLDGESPLGTDDGVVWAPAGDGPLTPALLLRTARRQLEGTPVDGADTDTKRESSKRSNSPAAGVRTDGAGGTDERATEALLSQLPAGCRLVLCTPALDDWPVALGRAAAERGVSVVVLSPDPTVGTLEDRIANARRRDRLRTLERVAETVDWRPGEPLDVALGGSG